MKEFIKASEDFITECLYEAKDGGDIERLLSSALWTFKKLDISDKLTSDLAKLEKKIKLMNVKNIYKMIHDSYWYLKQKDLKIENMDDFAKIVDDLNEEVYLLSEEIKKEG